jgi:hypothetical protein
MALARVEVVAGAAAPDDSLDDLLRSSVCANAETAETNNNRKRHKDLWAMTFSF